MWDPQVYLRFAEERGRPFHELVARIKAENPRRVTDLGCGPGNLTETLVKRWPGAKIDGIDASPEMIAEAGNNSAVGTAAISYEVGDVRAYVPCADVDVIVTNAVLQWVEGHEELVTRWVRPGRWIALQVPANHHEPAHTILRELCASPKWTDLLGNLADQVRDVPSAAAYARLLREAGCNVDAWETKYLHQLPVDPNGRHPVLAWLSGTGMRPVRQALTDRQWEQFCDDYESLLADPYPSHKNVVDFAFLRVFAVAYRRA